MSDLETHPEGPGQPIELVAAPRPRRTLLSSIVGVFAGTGRGAGIGASVGTCGCFLAMMAYALMDPMRRGDDGLPPGARLTAWAFLAVWFLVVSLLFGGVGGAILGAMVGALFPVRRGP